MGRPKLLRKVISRTETVVGAVLLLSIIAMTVWLIEQRDHYDPGERQIEGVDFVDAMRACPEGVDIATRLKLAQQLLA